MNIAKAMKARNLPFLSIVFISAVLLLQLLILTPPVEAFHKPGVGGLDYVTLSNITFIPLTSTGFDVESYSGSVGVIAVNLEPRNRMAFKFGTEDAQMAYVVIRQYDTNAVPVGSVIYYSSALGRWKLAQTGHPVWVPAIRRFIFDYVSLPLFVNRLASRRYATIDFDLPANWDPYPPHVTATLFEYKITAAYYLANGTPDYTRTFAGFWLANWINAMPITLTDVRYARYFKERLAFESPTPVAVGFTSPGESYLARADSVAVKLRYAYDTRYS